MSKPKTGNSVKHLYRCCGIGRGSYFRQTIFASFWWDRVFTLISSFLWKNTYHTFRNFFLYDAYSYDSFNLEVPGCILRTPATIFFCLSLSALGKWSNETGDYVSLPFQWPPGWLASFSFENLYHSHLNVPLLVGGTHPKGKLTNWRWHHASCLPLQTGLTFL